MTTVKVSKIARAKQLFAALHPVFQTQGGQVFRKQVLTTLVDEYGCSINNAAGAYNVAKKAAQAEDAKAWEGLGRPEGKNNGGRKKAAPVATTANAETADAAADDSEE